LTVFACSLTEQSFVLQTLWSRIHFQQRVNYRMATGIDAPQGESEDKEFMATLAKGLVVLASFGKQRPTMTFSEAASVAQISRAAARRVLRTLAELGYVKQNGRNFALSPNILKLGFAYLATQSWVECVQPLLTDLSERVRESSSAAILEDRDIVYVVRVPTRRIMTATISVGSRLPAFHTALGRVLLGYLDDAEIWRRLKSGPIEAYTPSTITDLQALFDRVKADHAQGFAAVEDELKRGSRAIAVPIIDRDGEAIGAIDVSTNSARITRNEMRVRFLPALRAAADQVRRAMV
jgi:IclR family pca regulon transcriptional regulator